MPSQPTIHQVERSELRSRWFIALALLLTISVLSATWLGLFTFLGLNSAYGTFNGFRQEYFPETAAVNLDLPDLSQVSRIFTEDGVLLAELHDGRNSEPARLEDVPEVLIDAILAAEDAEYFKHEGIDFSAIVSAFFDTLGGNTRGGSTITQQVVKQNFVGSELTIQRKITEALFAAELEQRYTKERILEFYINSVYFGWSAYGVKAASQEYFEKDMDDLTIAEAATISVLIRNPSLYDPRRQEERAHERRDDVINAMATHGFITESEAELAIRQPFRIAPPSEFDSPADHVVAEVRRQLLNDPEFAFLGATNEERKRAIFGCPADDEECEGGGGLNIYVTVDLDLQNRANALLQEWLPVPDETFTDPRGAPTGAIAMVDNRTGAVLVMSSGLPFEQEQFDLAVQGARNPGSAFKPIALVAYLESGGSLQSYWDARSPQKIDCGFPCGPGGSNTWTVRNAGGGGGLMSLFQATANSVNAVYAQLAVEVGPEKIVDIAHKMGIKSELEPVFALALGAGAVSPLEMASAFSNFATNGLHSNPYLVSRIQSVEGEPVYEHALAPEQILDPALLAAAREPLQSVVCCGTARAAQIGVAQGGKTGTHQSFREAWFVGFVPNLTTAVWVGFPDEQTELRNVRIHGQTYSRVFGGTVPAPIWAEFMKIVLEKYPVGEFPEIDGTGTYNVRPSTKVPSVVGLSQSRASEDIYNAHLSPSVVSVNSFEPAGVVISQAPEAGATVSHGAGVTIEVSNGLPPEIGVPDLRGRTVGEATQIVQDLMANSGVTINLAITFQEVTSPDLVDRVITTSPGPGGVVPHQGTLTLVVGRAAPPADSGGGG
ncbi:MAG: transglycosylase domain-containing protein [Acidimicrobiia bacterium]|nr:transglycosylase domain-containing protein [Acidimicrobiia bacterium]